jgi:hypothetical protein
MNNSSSGGSSGSGSRRGFGASGGGGVVSEFDESLVERLVDGVISDFEGRSELTLTPNARSMVLQPAIQHGKHILGELGSGAVMPEQIQDAVHTLLTNAERIARERDEWKIDEPIMRIAMRLECRYFPWC